MWSTKELALDREARAAGVNVIPDCGLAPGMVAVLVAQAASRFEKLDEIHIRVGGLPRIRNRRSTISSCSRSKD